MQMINMDNRYVYLMHLEGTREYKIGIAKNPDWRNRDIDGEVRGKVYIVIAKKTIFAERTEKRLHWYFRSCRFTKRGAGSGKTEWFKFTVLDSWLVQLLIPWFRVMAYIRFYTSILSLIILFFIFLWFIARDYLPL